MHEMDFLEDAKRKRSEPQRTAEDHDDDDTLMTDDKEKTPPYDKNSGIVNHSMSRIGHGFVMCLFVL